MGYDKVQHVPGRAFLTAGQMELVDRNVGVRQCYSIITEIF